MISYVQNSLPLKEGVYVCKIEGTVPNLFEDVFLTWFKGNWFQCFSELKFKGKVLGWIGPLPRKLTPSPESITDV